MAKTLQFRRGTTAELSSVTGAEGELFVDTTKDTVVVMDGSTAGGKPLATESYVGTAISNLVDSAPGALDTLNELAAALGDDANFATSVTNTIGVAGGYANSAYSQANTATTNAETADQRAVTSGSYANSAYSKANTAQIHAEAAFAAANTGGGGGGSSEITVNSDYSESINIANTYGVTSYTGTFTAGPDFGYITGGLDTTDASFNSMNPAASSINYNTSSKQLVLTGTDVNITNNINDWNTGYIQFSESYQNYIGKITNITVDGSTVTYTFENDSNLPQTDLNCDNYIYQSNYIRIYLDSVQPELDTLLSSQLKANATFTIDINDGASTYTRTVSLYSRDGGYPPNIRYSLRVDTITNISYTTVASIQIDGLVSSAQSWTFDIDGSFNTSSALVGDLLMTDDIITPLVYDSYGVVDANTTGTLTINGNLDILGTSSLGKRIPIKAHTEDSRSGAITAGKILEVGKEYMVHIGTDMPMNSCSLVLPSTTNFTGGEQVSVMNLQSSVNIKIFAYEDASVTSIYYNTLYNSWGVGQSSSGTDTWGVLTNQARAVTVKFVWAPDYSTGVAVYRWTMTI